MIIMGGEIPPPFFIVHTMYVQCNTCGKTPVYLIDYYSGGGRVLYNEGGEGQGEKEPGGRF